MALKQSKFIVISLGASVIKLAQVNSAGFVEKLLKKEVAANTPEAALREAFAGFDARNASVICVLPGDIATTKHLEVPSVEREEIESIIALQASRYTV
jgi:Tfp pilus assembly PilM family ATPase